MLHSGIRRAVAAPRPAVYLVIAGIAASCIGGMDAPPGEATKPAGLQHTTAPAERQDTVKPGSIVVLNKAQANGMVFTPGLLESTIAFSVGDGPHEVVLSGTRAIVSNYGGTTPGQSLAVVDLNDPGTTRTIMLGDYRRPHGLALFKDGQHVLVTAEVNQSIIKVDIESGKVVDHWETGQQGSHMVVLSPDEKIAYVTNVGSGSVSIVDLARTAAGGAPEPGTSAVINVPTAPGSEGLALSPDGKELWVAGNKSDQISILDTASRKVVETIACAKYPLRLAFTPDGKTVLAAASASGEIIFYDAEARKQTGRVATAPDEKTEHDPLVPEGPFKGSSVPIGIVIEPGGANAYVACTATGTIAKIDLAARRVVGHMRTGTGPDGIGLVP